MQSAAWLKRSLGAPHALNAYRQLKLGRPHEPISKCPALAFRYPVQVSVLDLGSWPGVPELEAFSTQALDAEPASTNPGSATLLSLKGKG